MKALSVPVESDISIQPASRRPSRIGIAGTSVRVLGLRMVAIMVLHILTGKLYQLLGSLVERVKSQDSFDKRYGTDTAGTLIIKDFDMPDSEAKSGAQRYWATPHKMDRYLLASLGIDYSKYTFVDYGSGKGRVLLVASEFPFREIIGVEFVPQLHEIAERNLYLYRSPRQLCMEISSVCMDAMEFSPPETPLVLHFYHPFDSESGILEKVLDNIDKSIAERPRPVWIIYVHQVHEAVAATFDKFPFLRKHREIAIVDDFWNTTIYTNTTE